MTSSRVRAVQELRRSNAAGTHSQRPTRARQLAAALADWADEQIPATAHHLIHTTQTQPRGVTVMFDPEPAREILARVIDGTTSTVDAALKIADHYGLALDTVGPIVAEVANNDAGLDIDWAVDSVRGSVEVSQLLPPPSSLEATAAAAVEHDEPEPPRWAPRPPQPPDIVADLLRRAALDPDLPDGAFVQLSRALREEAVTALSKAKTDPVLVALDHVLTRINQLDNPYAAVSLEWHQEWEDGRQAAANAVADAIIAHVNRLAKAVGS